MDGVVYDELPIAGLVRFNRPITVRGFLRYGRVDGRVVNIKIQNSYGTTTIPLDGVYIEEYPTEHDIGEIPEDDE